MIFEKEGLKIGIVMTEQEFCNGCDNLHRDCDVNEPSVREYFFGRGFCFDAQQNQVKGTMWRDRGFEPDRALYTGNSLDKTCQ